MVEREREREKNDREGERKKKYGGRERIQKETYKYHIKKL